MREQQQHESKLKATGNTDVDLNTRSFSTAVSYAAVACSRVWSDNCNAPYSHQRFRRQRVVRSHFCSLLQECSVKLQAALQNLIVRQGTGDDVDGWYTHTNDNV
eukprot:6178473-Pleurochrysis_carterae.AAC.1